MRQRNPRSPPCENLNSAWNDSELPVWNDSKLGETSSLPPRASARGGPVVKMGTIGSFYTKRTHTTRTVLEIFGGSRKWTKWGRTNLQTRCWKDGECGWSDTHKTPAARNVLERSSKAGRPKCGPFERRRGEPQM